MHSDEECRLGYMPYNSINSRHSVSFCRIMFGLVEKGNLSINAGLNSSLLEEEIFFANNSLNINFNLSFQKSDFILESCEDT